MIVPPAIDIVKILQQRELEATIRCQQELMRNNGIMFYQPHPKQKLFHEAGEYDRRYGRTGNRFGKTIMGTSEDISWCRGERVFYPKDHPTRILGIPRRTVKGVVFVADQDKVESLFTNRDDGVGRGVMFKLLPESWIAGTENNRQGFLYKILIKSIYGGVSSIQFETVKSFMQDPRAHESEAWDFIHIDEPCPHAMFTAYARGLTDRNGKAWFCCTPITEFWIDDYFIPKGMLRGHFENGESLKKNRWIMTGSTYDNPNLTPEGVASFEADLSPEERETRIEGKPRALSGAIYKQFLPAPWPEGHVIYGTPPGWDSPFHPPKDHAIKVMIDPHPQTPHHVLIGACSPGGYHTFFQEIAIHCLIQDLCKMMLACPGVAEAVKILIDPIAVSGSSTGDGTRMIDDFMQCGIFPIEATKDLMRGILSVQAVLAKRDLKGCPVVRFCEHLWVTRSEFERYVWDEKKGKPNATCPDHMMENLYRYVLDGMHYVDPARKDSKPVRPLVIVKPNYDLPKSTTLRHDRIERPEPILYRAAPMVDPSVFIPRSWTP